MDEMRFEDLLSVASEYAGLLKYTDAANRADGDWKAFFESDEASILASILATNLGRLEAESSRFNWESGTMLAKLRDGGAGMDIVPAFNLARKIESWFVKLGGLSSIASVGAHEKISELIEKTLREEFRKLHIFLRQYDAGGAEAAFQGFSGIWLSDNNEGGSVPGMGDAPRVIEQFLELNFSSFYNAVSFLQKHTADLLIFSLERRDHDPAIGLYIAFLKLFKKVQGKINDFTQRHLNFYYGDILKIQHREYVPDSAHLIFHTDIAGREVPIKRGTEFKGGLDENKIALTYAADNDLLVNDAKVCSLHTLFFERNALSSPENSLDSADGDGLNRKFATAAKLNRILDGGNLAVNSGSKAHPLFGDPQRSREKSSFEEARLGFAVASNVLLLKHGQRDITLTLKLATDDPEDSLDAFTGKLSKVLSTTEPDSFFKAFRHMFRISLTGEKGWLEVEEYLPLSHIVDNDGCEENSLKIQISLPESAEAIVPYSSAIHGNCFETDLPVITFSLNPVAYLYPYSLLCGMAVKEIVIDVEVRGNTEVLLYNQLGQLSANAQFNPFGPVPSRGDYFIVGNYEAARKNLSAFEINVEWGNLPQEMNGFEEYYGAYPMPFDNAIFKAGLSVLCDRKWIPADESEQPKTDLFESGKSTDKSVGKKRLFSFQGLCKFMRPLENISEKQYGYDVMAKDGFFKLTLVNPLYAFGYKDYPLVLSNVMTENASRQKYGISKLWSKSVPHNPLPNPPYTPLIKSVSVNYRAVSYISLERFASGDEVQRKEKMFHLHPLGVESLSPKAYGKIYLVPRFEADGNLFIGLSASKLPGLLTLFFHLREDSLPEAGARTFEFEWHYLASNQWKRLNKSQVVSDTTNGFLSSGIVTLNIPDDIDQGSTIMPGKLFWIRVSVNDSLMHTLCSLYGVHAQALKVSWKRQAGNNLSNLAARLPTGTIKEPKFSILGISGINQIMESFGGMPPESDKNWTVRVSERLRHKNRAITPWDYERLILQQFPDIYKVKCFPCMSGDAAHGGRAEPGQLLIVLIPYLKEAASVNLQPMVNALLLREVREYVTGLSSVFVKISVRNPAYEQIQVRCKVKFRQGMGSGFYLNEMNQDIVNYLSPWSPLGFEARFGWRIRCNEIQSHLKGLKYVESVSGLSMLQIRANDDLNYQLSDTARETVDEVKPAHPWSIAIPARRHLIEVVDDGGNWASEETGIASLAIGSTFILSRGNQ